MEQNAGRIVRLISNGLVLITIANAVVDSFGMRSNRVVCFVMTVVKSVQDQRTQTV